MHSLFVSPVIVTHLKLLFAFMGGLFIEVHVTVISPMFHLLFFHPTHMPVLCSFIFITVHLKCNSFRQVYKYQEHILKLNGDRQRLAQQLEAATGVQVCIGTITLTEICNFPY